MTADEAIAFVRECGVVLASGKGPVPRLSEAIVKGPIKGSWWGHPAGHAIFGTLGSLSESPDVIRVRLVNGKVTFVHRRLWPALVRVADKLAPRQLAALREEHTGTGAHRVHEEAFPSWVPQDVLDSAGQLTEEAAWAQLPACLRP
jgi:hypothetical protein